MKIHVSFEIAGLPPIVTNRRGNWRVHEKERKGWYWRVRCALNWQIPPVPCHTAKLTLVRKSSVEPDFDNLVASFKWVVDGLTRARVILDDKPSVIGQPSYRWVKAAKGSGSIFVSVEGECEEA